MPNSLDSTGPPPFNFLLPTASFPQVDNKLTKTILRLMSSQDGDCNHRAPAVGGPVYNEPLLRGHAASSSLHQVWGRKERRRKEEEGGGEVRERGCHTAWHRSWTISW
jgi:hypothetical protein